ncbi:hypothetical protein EBZ39_08665 [bacterium]|nr:hypothetical protein [bacterium]
MLLLVFFYLQVFIKMLQDHLFLIPIVVCRMPDTLHHTQYHIAFMVMILWRQIYSILPLLLFMVLLIISSMVITGMLMMVETLLNNCL